MHARTHKHWRTRTLGVGDGQLQGQAGQPQRRGQREGDGEPAEPAQQVACVCVFFLVVLGNDDVSPVNMSGLVGWLLACLTFDGGGGPRGDGALPVRLVDKHLWRWVGIDQFQK